MCHLHWLGEQARGVDGVCAHLESWRVCIGFERISWWVGSCIIIGWGLSRRWWRGGGGGGDMYASSLSRCVIITSVVS